MSYYFYWLQRATIVGGDEVSSDAAMHWLKSIEKKNQKSTKIFLHFTSLPKFHALTKKVRNETSVVATSVVELFTSKNGKFNYSVKQLAKNTINNRPSIMTLQIRAVICIDFIVFSSS